MTQIMDIELARPGYLTPVYATAGDKYSRFVEMHLYENGAPYTPPSGTTCLVGWRREGGAAGNYSTITESDETSTHAAYELEGSVLTVELSEDVCRLPGKVYLNVALQGTNGERLHTWELACQVERGAVADSEDGSQPSESASEAADRAEAAAAEAEAAAAEAEAALGQVDGKIDAAVAGVTSEAQQAAQDAAASAGQAAASAGQVEAALNELDGMLVDGPVASVNGKTGRVTLTAADVQALGLPAAPKAGQLLVVQSVGEDGSITVGTADSAPGGGFFQYTGQFPASPKPNTLYGEILADYT